MQVIHIHEKKSYDLFQRLFAGRGRAHDGKMRALPSRSLKRTFMTNFGTRLHTWLHGERVGEDEFGNRYFVLKGEKVDRLRKRWVIYKGTAEASKVPPDWHAWLHRTINEPPSRVPLPTQSWEKEHLPNLTGTKAAYLPQGHVLRGGQRAPATGDYEAWRPDS